MSTCNRTIRTLAVGALVATGALIGGQSAWASPGCPADFVPLPNGNGVVDVDDLLGVINTWGACAGCPSDFVPAGGNGVVDVDDLLGVINAWGNCPVVGPVNNECAGATVVVDGANNFDNTGATQSLPVPAADACIFGGPTQISRDVWFTYTATCTGVATFGTCATTGTFTDTVIVAYDACGGNQIGCDDDACAATTNFLSELSLNVTTGQVIKLRVGSWGAVANNQGAGVLTITCTPADNDFCTDATAVAIGGNVNGNVFAATPEANGPPTCNSVNPPVGRWHTVVGNGTTLTASTCGSPGELWDSVLGVYCGTGCDDLVCVAASSDTGCGPLALNESVSWCAAAGQTYLILVGHDGTQPQPGEGNYNLAITSGAACANPIQCFIPPPANDECAGAVVVNTGANNLNNDGATDSANAGLECAGGGSVNAERDIWAVWTATCSGAAIIDTCATPGAVSDTILGVYTGTCAGGLTEVGCDEDSCVVPPAINDFNSSVSVSVTSGQQYFIRIASFTGSPDGDIVLTIACDSSVVCGNGVLEPGEQCDDGNNVPNDGCTNCTVDTPTFPCVGTPEGFPCRVDGDVAATDPNGGCNSSPPAFGSTILLNETFCGQTSTYINSLGGASRDTDWILFTPSVTGNYQIVMFAPSFTPQTGFLFDPVSGNVTDCPGAAFVPGSAVGGTPGVPLVTNAVLNAGTVYGVFAARLTTTPPQDVACANGLYSIRVTYQPLP